MLNRDSKLYKSGYKNGYAGTKKRAPETMSPADRFNWTAGYLEGGNDYINSLRRTS